MTDQMCPFPLTGANCSSTIYEEYRPWFDAFIYIFAILAILEVIYILFSWTRRIVAFRSRTGIWAHLTVIHVVLTLFCAIIVVLPGKMTFEVPFTRGTYEGRWFVVFYSAWAANIIEALHCANACIRSVILHEEQAKCRNILLFLSFYSLVLLLHLVCILNTLLLAKNANIALRIQISVGSVCFILVSVYSKLQSNAIKHLLNINGGSLQATAFVVTKLEVYANSSVRTAITIAIPYALILSPTPLLNYPGVVFYLISSSAVSLLFLAPSLIYLFEKFELNHEKQSLLHKTLGVASFLSLSGKPKTSEVAVV